MRRVAIAAAATSKFTKSSDRPIFELACEPCIEILRETEKKGERKKDIDAVLLSTCSQEQYSSAIVSEMLGLQPKVSQRIDNLCNSGTNAIASAYSMIAAGLADSALIVGAEKADSSGNRLTWDVTRGEFNFPVHWAAMFARAHMRRYGTTEEQMAQVSVNNHEKAA
ncbi:MAG: thiolase family protein, partial [Thermoproteota archaeon]